MASIDISSIVDWRSVDFTSILTKETGTASFTIRQNAAASVSIPAIGDTIELYDSSGIIWGGTLTEREPTISGLMITWQLKATDWGFEMDGTLVKKNYSGVDPSAIAIDIIDTFCAGKGINAATVANGGYVQVGNFNVPTIQFNYQQPSKALQSLANLIGWDWYIDPNKNLHFFLGDIDDNAGGGAVGDGGKAPITIDGVSGNIMWNTLDIDENITNLQNSVYVIGGSYPKVFTAGNTYDTYQTNGVQQSFPVAYAYTESTVEVTLGGVAQRVGILNQVTDPTSVQVLYDSTNRNIQFTSGAPSSGQTVKIFGQANVPIVANATNATSITTYGLREGVIVDSKITSVQEAQLRAQAQIDQFGHAVYDLKVTTDTPGCRIGQVVMANVPSMGITNYPLIIKRVEATVLVPGAYGQLQYQLECIGSDNVTFTDLMTTILQQEAVQTTVGATTINENLVVVPETVTLADVLTVTVGARPYSYGPVFPANTSGFDISPFDTSGFDADSPEANVGPRYNYATYG
jgi:hypothetical protein